MTWMLFEDDRRQPWLVNQEGLWLLCQQAVYAQMMWERMKVVPEKRPWFWRGNDIRNVEFDFKDFHPTKIQRAQDLYGELTIASLRNAADVFDQLTQLKDELDLLTRRVKGKQSEIARDNADAVDHNVGFFGSMAKGAKIIRDASATILLAGASIMSGGAAVAALGAGSVLKGTATYEDKVNLGEGRRVGAALLTATSTFGVGMIPGGTGAKRYVLIAAGAVAHGALTLGTGLVQGDGVRKSLIAATMDAGISAIPLGPRLKTMGVPVEVQLKREAAELGLKTAVKRVDKAAAKLAAKKAAHRYTGWAEKDVKTAAEKLAAAKLASKDASKLTVREVVATSAGSLASVDGDLAKGKAVEKFGKSAKPLAVPSVQVPDHQQHLVGVSTQLDQPATSAGYILQTALCPAASYKQPG